MSRAKPKFCPDPRFWSQYQVAAYLGRSEQWFMDAREKLEERGFPRYDDLMSGWDSVAIKAFFDGRAGLPTQSTESPLERWLREQGRGSGIRAA